MLWCYNCMKRRPPHFTGYCCECGRRLYGICLVCFYLALKGRCTACASERAVKPNAAWIRYAELCPEHRGHKGLLGRIPYLIECQACRDSIKRSVRDKMANKRRTRPRYRASLRHADWDGALRKWIASCHGHVYDPYCCPWNLEALKQHLSNASRSTCA